jgi:hypothetical protein
MKSGQPLLLTGEQLELVEMVIHASFDRREPVTYSWIMTELELESGVYLSPDILRHIIHRIFWCKTVDGVPQEVSRLQHDEEEIDRYCEYLEKTLAGVPSAARYNVDETGFDTWVDASRLRGWFPSTSKIRPFRSQ